MTDGTRLPVCPTLLFGQFEIALRDNDFIEVNRLRSELEALGVRIQVDFWPPVMSTQEDMGEEVAPC
jgi:hypothetical protein